MDLDFRTPDIDPGRHPAVLWDRRRYITLFGEAYNDPTLNLRVDALSGDQPPTIVGGYSKWQSVDLPLRTGLTVYQGRDETSMQVSLRLMKFDASGSWLTGVTAGTLVEDDVRALDWMAGGGGSPAGLPPLVFLSTFSSNGSTVPLIPFNYQADTAQVSTFLGGQGGYPFPWVVTSLAWDPAPIRNENAFRVRQDVTLTFQFYNPPAGPPGTTPRARGITVTSKAGADTALKIARAANSPNPPNLATGIMQATPNKRLALRSIYTKIRHGKRVYIPALFNS